MVLLSLQKWEYILKTKPIAITFWYCAVAERKQICYSEVIGENHRHNFMEDKIFFNFQIVSKLLHRNDYIFTRNGLHRLKTPTSLLCSHRFLRCIGDKNVAYVRMSFLSWQNQMRSIITTPLQNVLVYFRNCSESSAAVEA